MVDNPLNDHGWPWSKASSTIIDHELTIINWPWSTMVKHGQTWSVSSGIDHNEHVMTMAK